MRWLANPNPITTIPPTLCRWLIAIHLICGTCMAHAETANIAVASNFHHAFSRLVSAFEQQSPHQIRSIIGSTGKHYAQIQHGAPFDAFFAADTKRPDFLAKQRPTGQPKPMDYAIGHLVLWSPQKALVDQQGHVLYDQEFNHIAMANPKLAPYGQAALTVLEKLGLFEQLTPKLVRGENIGQTYQYVKSGNAQLGFIALSQLTSSNNTNGSLWHPPTDWYPEIRQRALLLSDNPAAIAFWQFIQTPEAKEIIQSSGYSIP